MRLGTSGSYAERRASKLARESKADRQKDTQTHAGTLTKTRERRLHVSLTGTPGPMSVAYSMSTLFADDLSTSMISVTSGVFNQFGSVAIRFWAACKSSYGVK